MSIIDPTTLTYEQKVNNQDIMHLQANNEASNKQQEQGHIKYYSEISNKDRSIEEGNHLLLNLSLREILAKWSETFVNIINEITSGNKNDLRSIISIFVKGDRMIYVGLTLIMIAFSIYLIDITG
uniref:Uncharacterized protein n=1 Tax=viral metagenome TaxID=1070528 RepID=A0A6C0J4F0_9ZZZZ